MPSKSSQPISGQLLLADYQTAFVSAATIEAATYEAKRSEDELMNQLGSMSSGAYLNPSALASTDQSAVSRASLDAHVKKIQAQQLTSMNQQQLLALLEQDQALYKGRKVQVTKLDSKNDAIESEWFNPHTGYRHALFKNKKVTGTIESVLLNKNMLVLKPLLLPHLFSPELTNYIVYIIDPNTLEPLVKLDIL